MTVSRWMKRFTVSAGLIAWMHPADAAQGLRKFGPPPGKPALRAFGNPVGEDALRRQFPKLAAAVVASDRTEAAREIQRTDANGDGIVTQAEWTASGYQSPDRFLNNDLNRDGILTHFEHSLRWAQYRVGRETAAKAQSSPPIAKDASAALSSNAPQTGRDDLRSKARRAQLGELTNTAMALYDRNRNRRLELSEIEDSPEFGDLRKADTDKDGAIVPVELAAWLTALLAAQPSPKPPPTAPPWFRAADANADGQVHLSEYRRVGPKDVFTAFDQYDHNADGFVTAGEAAALFASDTVRYPSGRPAVIEAETETRLELLVSDDVTIRDLDLQLVLMKNGDDDIEVSLMAPDGTRAALYFDAKTKPWAGGRLFADTLIDDEAPAPAQRLTRPPLHRSFRSQGSTVQGQQGLKALYGKNARGTWRLVIRNNSQIAGLLESWALVIRSTKPASSPPVAPSAR